MFRALKIIAVLFTLVSSSAAEGVFDDLFGDYDGFMLQKNRYGWSSYPLYVLLSRSTLYTRGGYNRFGYRGSSVSSLIRFNWNGTYAGSGHVGQLRYKCNGFFVVVGSKLSAFGTTWYSNGAVEAATMFMRVNEIGNTANEKLTIQTAGKFQDGSATAAQFSGVYTDIIGGSEETGPPMPPVPDGN